MAQRRKQAQEVALRNLLKPTKATDIFPFLRTIGVGKKDVDPETGLPVVPPPPGWGVTPGIDGPGTDIARMLRQLESISPGIREKAGKITMGPNTEDIERLLGPMYDLSSGQPQFLGQGLTPLDLGSMLGGAYYQNPGSISVNPKWKGSDLFEVLAHELQHASMDTGPLSFLMGPVPEIGHYSGDILRKFGTGYGPHERANLAGAVAKMIYEDSDSPPSQLHQRDLSVSEHEDLDELFRGEPWYRQGLLQNLPQSSGRVPGLRIEDVQ
jgi:hypothetical protein